MTVLLLAREYLGLLPKSSIPTLRHPFGGPDSFPQISLEYRAMMPLW
jgi:hypothetical protein